MRILHIATSDIGGGAALAAYGIHTGLRRLGQDSVMFVMNRESEDRTVRAFVPPTSAISRLRRRLRYEQIARSFSQYRSSRPAGYERFDDDRTAHRGMILDQLPQCDIINLHWISGFVDYQDFFLTRPSNTPVVWRLADMAPFTGGCHFDDGCGKYAVGCGACPQLGSPDPGDLSGEVWRRKHAALAAIDPRMLHIVALNRGAAEDLKRSSLFERFPVTVIPNGVDPDAFAPRGRAAARQALGLPCDARIVLFGAEAVINRRKGFGFLEEALTGLDQIDKFLLLTVGKGKLQTQGQIPHIQFGYLENARLLSLVYSAADLFVFPSLQEMFAKAPLEAMACGTPVIGFEGVGGFSDIVRPGVTGELVRHGDSGALRRAIIGYFEDSARHAEMSDKCRQLVLSEFTLAVQVKRYLELYRSLTSPQAA
jgi:glycosyltransferase involved in cell wall biosynthesis